MMNLELRKTGRDARRSIPGDFIGNVALTDSKSIKQGEVSFAVENRMGR